MKKIERHLSTRTALTHRGQYAHRDGPADARYQQPQADDSRRPRARCGNFVLNFYFVFISHARSPPVPLFEFVAVVAAA
jgi:hypothetical protein